MKKFNNWMLTNHPLIWNTRFHIMLPVVIILNIIFFFWGYCEDITLKNVGDWGYQTTITINAIAVLISFLLILIWLVFYLRHNAFKALLPISKFYLQKEFLVILIVIFGLASPIVLTECGANSKIKRVSKSVNIAKERRIEALAKHFLPFDLNRFSGVNQHVTDTGADTSKLEPGMVAGLSYLNYRSRSYFEESESDSDSLLDVKAISWLKNHRKDSIINCIDKYLQLCRKYGADYKFNSTNHVNNIFSTTDFIVKEEIPTYRYGQSGVVKNYYIERYYLVSGAISKIENARQGLRSGEYAALMMWTLCLSCLLFSFRITPLRTWITSIVVALVLTICTIVSYASTNDESILTLSPIVIGLGGLLISIINIFAKKHKYLAGVAYLLFLFVSTFFVIAVYGFAYKCTYYYYGNVEVSPVFSDRLHDWLGNNTNNFFIANCIFCLLIVLVVMIPLIKKWRANPEE